MAKVFVPFDAFRRGLPDHFSSRLIHPMKRNVPAYRGSVSPRALFFGSRAVGELSEVQTVTLTNTGFKALPIKEIRAVGDYVVTTNCPVEGELAPGATCSIQVNFIPQREGVSTGGVYVDTGDAAGTEFAQFNGSGTPQVNPGTGPFLSISPSPLAFGQVTVGEHTEQLVTLTNTGNQPLVITSATLGTGPFQLALLGSTVPITLVAGQSTQARIRYAPTVVGSNTTALTLVHTGQGARTLNITGSGVVSALPVLSISNAVIVPLSNSPFIEMSPSALSFPATLVGETSTMLLTVTNSGPVAASIASVVATGDYSTDWTIEEATVDAESLVQFTVSFAPTTAGVRSGSVVVTLAEEAPTGLSYTVVTTGSASEEELPPVPLARLTVSGNQFVEEVSGDPVRLRSVNWFGAEGTNYTPHGTWQVPWKGILDQIKDMGFNCVRLPFSGDTTTPDREIPVLAINEEVNPDLVGLKALEVFDLILDYCERIGLYVVLDHHRRQAGNGADGAPTGTGYTQAQWLASWGVMVNRYKDHSVVIGADVHNEPHDLTWDAWATAAEACGNHIHTIAPHWLIFVEGVGSNPDATPYWWGGALKGVATRPVELTVPNRVVYSPHDYGHSVGSQSWLATDGNPVANYPNNLYSVFRDNWGFIFEEGIAPIWVGEFGGHFGVDGTGGNTKPHATQESQWVTTLIKYLNGDFDGDNDSDLAPGQLGMSAAFWSYNPNSGDTGGLVQDDWETAQTVKLGLLAPFLS